MEELKILPETVTKKELQKMYHGLPQRIIREELNYYTSALGKNVRCRKIPKEVILMFVRDYGVPQNYTLSVSMRENLTKIKR